MRSHVTLLLALSAAACALDSSSLPAFDSEPNDYDAEHGSLEPRQAINGVNQNGQAAAAPTQQPAVTVFGMNVAVGATVQYQMITYTQTFADVPDQLPTAVPGTIGYGTLTKHGKREATLAPGLPLVLELQYVQVDIPLQPVVRVIEVVNIPSGWKNGTFNTTSNATTSHGTAVSAGLVMTAS